MGWEWEWGTGDVVDAVGRWSCVRRSAGAGRRARWATGMWDVGEYMQVGVDAPEVAGK